MSARHGAFNGHCSIVSRMREKDRRRRQMGLSPWQQKSMGHAVERLNLEQREMIKTTWPLRVRSYISLAVLVVPSSPESVTEVTGVHEWYAEWHTLEKPCGTLVSVIPEAL